MTRVCAKVAAVIVDLEQIGPKEGGCTDLPFAVTVGGGAEIAFAHPVEGVLHLTRTGETVRVTGEAATMVTLTCGRCLRPFDHRLVGMFNEDFHPGGSATEIASRYGLSEGDFVVALEGTQLDVTEVVRQHLLMALPMVPPCRADCRGLCPRYGADWNERASGCAQDAVDPRLAALEGFRSASG
jgi:uncharacterized protein